MGEVEALSVSGEVVVSSGGLLTVSGEVVGGDGLSVGMSQGVSRGEVIEQVGGAFLLSLVLH